ncbi:MAG: hypothetical protein IKI05_03355 [Bacteroidaceae bacterium]|nr:hypothetical protein [Bacteroidaceae bacterium]
MEKQRRIRGSAVVDDEGMFLFTPYGQAPAEAKTTILAATRHGTIREGKHSVTLQVSVRKSETNDPIYTLLSRAATLTATAKNKKKW